jgi:hypothetical protein
MGVPSISNQQLLGSDRESIERFSDFPISELEMVNRQRPEVEPEMNPPDWAFGSWATQMCGIHDSNSEILIERGTPL